MESPVDSHTDEPMKPSNDSKPGSNNTTPSTQNANYTFVMRPPATLAIKTLMIQVLRDLGEMSNIMNQAQLQEL